MCNTLEIPHLEARPEARMDPAHLFSMNMHPETSQLTRAYLDLLKMLKWKKFCVIYGDQAGESIISNIITLSADKCLQTILVNLCRYEDQRARSTYTYTYSCGSF